MKHEEILSREAGVGAATSPTQGALKSLPWLKRLGKGSPHILLLQGPAGPAFRSVQTHLEKAGFAVNRVRFHSGDRLHAHTRGGLDFSGDMRAWRFWLTELLLLHNTRCILLYGSDRPLHRAAILIARKLGIPVLALEEGYIRPGFVTAEFGGNNAQAPLARALPVSRAPNQTAPQPLHVRSHRAWMYAYNAAYYSASKLPNARSREDTRHRDVVLRREILSWARNAWRKWRFSGQDKRVLAGLSPDVLSRTFVVPLQVASDCNLKEAANGWTNDALVRLCIQSFAHHAGPNQHLLFKLHPMDRGHSRAHRDIARLAQAYGISARVDFVSDAAMGPLVRGAAGMITINSSAGLSALHHKTPLLVLGQALYAHPELATCSGASASIDQFWEAQFAPDPQIADGFLEHLKAQSLLSGDFYSAQGIAAVCAALNKKIQTATAR